MPGPSPADRAGQRRPSSPSSSTSSAAAGDQVHQQLFVDLMLAAGLDANHLGYIDAVPAETLAVVNLMSLFGLHRAHRAP